MLTIAHPAHLAVEGAAAALRQATTLGDYLAAREALLEALWAAVHAEAGFWGI